MTSPWFYKQLVEMVSETINTSDPTPIPACSEKINVRAIMETLISTGL